MALIEEGVHVPRAMQAHPCQDGSGMRSALSMPSDAEPRQLNALPIKLIAGVSKADHRRVTFR
ncbi:hypothetical protein [Sphingomonas sp. PP-CE-1G-424]|uniref:hypothetical protein n=1 Tax=Sphingomonas sp. PP-CE-1G-424 TaxID=2135658 RepID=UPI0010543D08|nr:hypothetical protein [Sphingomonas sp. PP-CE-1G-424]